MDSERPPTSVSLAALLEATGDSESDTAAEGGWSSVHADDGDAESCCGAAEDGSAVELLSWERWMLETASHNNSMVDGDGTCAAASTAAAAEPEEEDAAGGRDDESDRLFWEACIAHGY